MGSPPPCHDDKHRRGKAFLGACSLVIDKVDYRLAVLGGIAVWLAAALAIFLAPRYL
ncbi:hypothetical protein OOJ09_28325 [Mesorhizobium qingshengii]|uniref:Uncharacterized protein n=1 Tax=Mesorhizobium qingshengii TaxID=1165689 RepID=A0ABT4R2X6_9HYPH|nr:hypothetical protein [Mesorhizobium qingshengii]MCZ8548101.1 hypothetical protein [Mesorhizobium qingshengii]